MPGVVKTTGGSGVVNLRDRDVAVENWCDVSGLHKKAEQQSLEEATAATP